jgi:hypothetical protein
MLSKTQITAILALSAACWVGLLVIRGVPLTREFLWPFGSVVSAVSFLLLIFDIWAWKLPIFRGWLIKRPILHGTWKVVLQSDWKNPETGQTIDPIQCFMVVRQTSSKLSLRLLTPESSSETVSAGIEVCKDGTFEVSCTYRNKPKSMYRYRSEVHYGAMLLSAEQVKPGRLEGEYWTDRKTIGSVVLTDRNRRAAMTFSQAEALFT